MDLSTFFPHPIIQGPMAGGSNTPALVAAVSNSGGCGSLGASLLSPLVIREQVAQIRALSDKPFLINLFVQPMPQPSAQEVSLGVQLLKAVWSSLGWETLPQPGQWCEDFAAQFECLLELKPAIASFTFNILTPDQVARLHQAGIFVIGTVTTVAEAVAWRAVGADAVCASGVEAGGHRGTFLVPQTEATLSTMALLPLVREALPIPVIAAGGIMDGHDINNALALGAQAVQMGTAFLVCDESGIHPGYKRRLLTAGNHPTRLTRAFSGRYSRGLENRFMQLMESAEKDVPAYPIQNALTGSIRAAAAKLGDTELMSLWAGAAVSRARGMTAARLMVTLVQEMRA
jgi:nitronate monooxygenase